MLTPKEITDVFDLFLSSPGMKSVVRINFRASRKSVLLLSKIIELGLSTKDNAKNVFFDAADDQTIEEIKAVSTEIIAQADLAETSIKLNSLLTK
jgi:hypothetical protein